MPHFLAPKRKRYTHTYCTLKKLMGGETTATTSRRRAVLPQNMNSLEESSCDEKTQVWSLKLQHTSYPFLDRAGLTGRKQGEVEVSISRLWSQKPLQYTKSSIPFKNSSSALNSRKRGSHHHSGLKLLRLKTQRATSWCTRLEKRRNLHDEQRQ